MVGIVKRTSFLDTEIFKNLYKALVRPNHDYGNIMWSPYLKRQSVAIERVQRGATRLVSHLKDWNTQRD